MPYRNLPPHLFGPKAKLVSDDLKHYMTSGVQS